MYYLLSVEKEAAELPDPLNSINKRSSIYASNVSSLKCCLKCKKLSSPEVLDSMHYFLLAVRKARHFFFSFA
jgi:hypothetical protein